MILTVLNIDNDVLYDDVVELQKEFYNLTGLPSMAFHGSVSHPAGQIEVSDYSEIAQFWIDHMSNQRKVKPDQLFVGAE